MQWFSAFILPSAVLLDQHVVGGRFLQDFEPVRIRPFTTLQILLSKRLNVAPFSRQCRRGPPTARPQLTLL